MKKIQKVYCMVKWEDKEVEAYMWYARLHYRSGEFNTL
jgi:hypothetical protein